MTDLGTASVRWLMRLLRVLRLLLRLQGWRWVNGQTRQV